jgi:hypothetical protein
MRKISLAAGAALFALTGTVAGSAAAGELMLFEKQGFRGDRMVVTSDVRNLSDTRRWNDRARSLVVESGAWEVCRDSRYRGTCVTLRPGEEIADLRTVGMRDAISSVREIDEVALGDGWRGRDRFRDRDRFGDRDDFRRDMSACQSRVYDGLTERFGNARGGATFSGDSNQGTVNYEGRTWRYNCEGGQVNIW